MSLNWKFSDEPFASKVAKWKELDWPMTACLIFSTMLVDMPGLPKPEDVDEFLFRLEVCRASGHSPMTEMPPADVLRRELVARVGLTTNVSRKTRAQWMRRVAKWLEQDAAAAVRGAKLTAEAEEVAHVG